MYEAEGGAEHRRPIIISAGAMAFRRHSRSRRHDLGVLIIEAWHRRPANIKIMFLRRRRILA